MTSRERFRRYLAGLPIDRAPALEWAPWWDLTLNRWHQEDLPSSFTEVGQIQDFFGLDKCIQTFLGLPMPDKIVEYGQGYIEDEKDWEAIKDIVLAPPEIVFPESRIEALKQLPDRDETIHFISVQGFFWMPRVLFGIENHLYSFYDYPELYKQICDAYADWMIEFLHYLLPRFHYDFLSFAEDMSYNLGPMISKECFDEFLAPFYRKVIPVIHSYGIPIIVDSDGDITKAVDWYASVGADGMLPLERQAGVDVAFYLDKQPQMCFLGHFDKMCMKHGTDAMRAEFERLLPSMKRGKFIPSVDHQTPPDVSTELYREYVKLLFEYCGKIQHEEGQIQPCPVFQSSNTEVIP